MKYVVRAVSLLIFIAIVALTPSTVKLQLELQQNKTDLGELNNIYYGVFSVNAWKGQIAEILFAEVNNIDIKTTVSKLRATVEGELTTIIDKLNERVREANKGSLGGKLKQSLIDLVVDVKEIKKGVPTYADALIQEVTKPETEQQVKKMAKDQLKAYFAKTYQPDKDTYREAILARNSTTDIDDARVRIADRIQSVFVKTRLQMAIIIGLAILMFVVIIATRTRTAFEFVLMVLTLFMLMGIGVSTPMIDLDARISEFSFYLLGHKVYFENQVLYFQSKSVLNVFMIMIEHHDILMKLVGILMVTFSIVFPTLKLSSSLLYYFKGERVRNNRLIRFFVFQSGKWSMADVMVIAIFMAYIGFNGIVNNQFSKIQKMIPADIIFITTNGTSLQPGYFAFLAYAILALVLSSMLSHGDDARRT